MEPVSSGTELTPVGHLVQGEDGCLPGRSVAVTEPSSHRGKTWKRAWGLEAVWAPPSGRNSRDGGVGTVRHPVTGT